jgi:hypothetical protein
MVRAARQSHCKEFSLKREISNVIERVETFEDRLQVRLQGLYAEVDGDWVIVNGEVHSKSEAGIAEDIEIHTTVYDAQGKVLHTTHSYVSADSFFGFQAFREMFQPPPSAIAKIRVYPRHS